MSIHYNGHKTQQHEPASTDQQESITQPVKSPMRPSQPSPPHGRRTQWFAISALLVVLVLVLALGGVFVMQLASKPATQPTPSPVAARTPTSAPTTGTTPTPTQAATATPIPSLSPFPLISTVWMSDATTGWARTTTHQIIHTTDGGKSWQDVTPPYSPASSGQFPPAFASLSGSMAWVVTSEKLPDGTITGVIFRTSDSGRNWQHVTLPASQLGGDSHVQFVNAQDGWILSSPDGAAAGSEGVNLFRSTDGGQSWSLVASTPGSLPLSGIKSGMGWISATTGWITGSIATNTAYLYRTQNAGVSWQLRPLPSFSPTPIGETYPPVFFKPR